MVGDGLELSDIIGTEALSSPDVVDAGLAHAARTTPRKSTGMRLRIGSRVLGYIQKIRPAVTASVRPKAGAKP